MVRNLMYINLSNYTGSYCINMHIMHCMLINFCILSVAPTVSFGELTYNVDEHNGSALLTVVLSKQSSMDITIKVLTVDGTAIGESILNCCSIF